MYPLKKILLCLLLLLSTQLYGQEDDRDSEMILAENLFNEGEYEKALSIYLKYDGKRLSEPKLKYRIGVCYYHSLEKARAVEYLELSLKHRDDEVPPEVNYYLGRLKHFAYQFEEAIAYFEAYKADEKNFNLVFLNTDRLIEMCENGKKIIKLDEKAIDVDFAKPPLNSSYNDYAPVVRPNGGALFISSNRPTESVDLVFREYKTFFPKEWENLPEDVFVSYPRGIDWGTPYPADLQGQKVVPLSLRNYGSEMLLYIGDAQGNGDLFLSEYKGARWTTPKKVDKELTGKKQRFKGACFAENGRAIYFSSDREGGFGGFDLYIIREEGKGWSKAQNLGETINTKYDEVTPFMHSDEQSFFFSSDGHSSIGGFDIFETTTRYATEWKQPRNLGYPINSSYDDMYYVQQADGKYGYLSSNRVEDKFVGNWDIITVFKPQKENPLAMVKGKITVERDGERVPVTLKVYEKTTRKPVNHVYNPTMEDGSYFMILAPYKVYDVRIESGNEYAYQLEISLPANVYTYEMNKSLVIEPYNLFGQQIGEKPEAIEDKYSMEPIDSVEGLRNIRYDAMLLFMERAIDAQERERFTSLNELDAEDYVQPKGGVDPYYTPLMERMNEIFSRGKPEDLKDLDKPYVRKEVVFYGQQIGNRKLITSLEVPFSQDSTDIPDQITPEMKKLAQLMESDKDLTLEIIQPQGGNSVHMAQVKSIEMYLLRYNDILAEQIVKKTGSEEENTIRLRLFEENQQLD